MILQFAHTLGAGGPDLELMVIAGALAVLGIVFFFQEAVKPLVSFALIAAGIVAGAVAFAIGGADVASQPTGASVQGAPGGATVEILSPSDGDTVSADQTFDIEYRVDTGTLDDEEVGDMHVYVDGQLQSMQTAEVLEAELEPGSHTVAVELAQADHSSFEPAIIDEIRLTAE